MKLLQRQVLPLSEDERLALCADLLRREREEPSHASHNRGGWRTHHNWLATVPWLGDRILTNLMTLPGWPAQRSRLSIRGWGVVNRAGAYHQRHVHSATHAWSGVLYLDSGGDNAATVFELDKTGHPVLRVEPEVGQMVVFDSQIWHSVEAHKGDRPRITIAFDVAVRPAR